MEIDIPDDLSINDETRYAINKLRLVEDALQL
jgi:hypothetical protein